MTPVNRQLRLKTRPDGLVTRENFDLIDAAVPSCKTTRCCCACCICRWTRPTACGCAMCRNICRRFELVKPCARWAWAGCLNRVRQRSARGDLVQGLTGWQDYCIFHADTAGYVTLPSDPGIALPTLLGACGMSGITAYYGMTDIAPTGPGQTLVVSAAAGSVGSVAGQIGKIQGARVVGIAGGAEKCRYLTDELGFDAAVDYKADDFKQQLKAATPEGVHVNFENVGGAVMRSVLSRMVIGGRVALCGLISGYNSDEGARDDYGVIVMKRLAVQGFSDPGLPQEPRGGADAERVGYQRPDQGRGNHCRRTGKRTRSAQPAV